MPQIHEITDFSAPELDVFARLTEAQLRNRLEPEKGIFIAESPKVIHRALDAGYRPHSLLMEHKHLLGDGQSVLARCGEDLPVFTAADGLLAQLTGYPMTRGVLCAMYRPSLPDPAALCQNAHRVAVLENIVDHTNLGAIFRSAAALGIDAVLLTPSCCDPLYRRAARVSMGTVFQVPWTRIGSAPADWPQKGLALLNDMGFQTVSMALRRDTVDIDDPSLTSQPKLAILLGTEGDGLAEETISRSDHTVRIPMAHNVDSLNVAAASAVAFWALRWRG